LYSTETERKKPLAVGEEGGRLSGEERR